MLIHFFLKLSLSLWMLVVFSTGLYAEELRELDGFTPYGYTAEKIIKLYEGNEAEKNLATITFAHVFYAVHVSESLVEEANKPKFKYFYCNPKVSKKPLEAMDLYISWVKLKSVDDKKYLKDPLPISYPLFLKFFYPISTCSGQ